MFTLLDPSFLNKEKWKIAKLGGFLTPSFLKTPKEASSADRRGDRRKKPRREMDKYKKASHKPYRYTLCAQNKDGERDPKSANLNIIIVHGLRGYEGLYEGYAEYHTAKGRNAIILDFPGHGKNPGEPCRIHHMRYFETCVESAIVEAYKLNPRAPIVLITFSMGGLVTLQYLYDSAPSHIKARIAGVVCLGVPLDVGKKISLSEALLSALSCLRVGLLGLFKTQNDENKELPLWKIFFGPYLAYICPWWKIKELSIDKDNISHDPETIREVCEDPMIYKGPLRAWTAYSILKMANNVFSLLKNKELGIPRLYLRGELDNTAERGPYEEAGIPIKDYKGFKHELLKGIGSDAVRADIDAWIEAIAVPSWKRMPRIKT